MLGPVNCMQLNTRKMHNLDYKFPNIYSTFKRINVVCKKYKCLQIHL